MYMKNPLILAIDIGTQSLRAGLVNKKGEIEYIVKDKYNPPYQTTFKGEAVQDADFYYDTMIKAIKKLKAEAKKDFERIEGLTLDTIRDTAVMLDKDFKPLHKCIIWVDQRFASGSMENRPAIHRFLFKVLGLDETMRLNIRKSMSIWYQENRPDLWEQMKYYGNLSSYLTYKITSQWADSPASMTGHFPMNFKKCEYYKSEKSLTNIFRIPVEVLPRLVPQGEIIGKVNQEFSKLTGVKEGLPMISCGSDKSCETLGCGLLSNDVAAVSYGTASTIEVTTKKYRSPEPFLPAYPFALKGYYNMEVQIYRGYWMINWFLKNFCHFNLTSDKELIETLNKFNQRMTKIPAGSDGLILQPYWQPGLSRPLAKGAIIGFSSDHTSAHFYRAIIEGIAYALREGFEYFEKKNHQKIHAIKISGGGSQSDEICQITADIFGVPVKRVQTYETSVLGAGIAGFLGLKEFVNAEQAIKFMVHDKDVFKPDIKQHKIYNTLFKDGYKKMYPQLKPIYKDMFEFIHLDDKFANKSK